MGEYEVKGVAERKRRMFGSMKLGYILPVPPATAILTILLSSRVTLSSTESQLLANEYRARRHLYLEGPVTARAMTASVRIETTAESST